MSPALNDGELILFAPLTPSSGGPAMLPPVVSAAMPACTSTPSVTRDADWLARIQRGDPVAHETLFRVYAPGLYAFLSRYVRSSAIAEDLVQDLFLAIWAHRESLHIDGSIRTYLFTAARNRALNHLKHEKIADRFRVAMLDRVDASDPSAPGESDFLAAMEVQTAIDRLPPRCRLIFTMSRQQDMTYNQIACELGISVKTVEVQMGRALKSLRAHHRESIA
jgi:RNA polymerase sigma-70 factor, ECF subfamily